MDITMDSRRDQDSSLHKLLLALVHVACFLALLEGCYCFMTLDPDQTDGWTCFVPFGVVFVYSIAHNFIWVVLPTYGLSLTQMDPLTAIFLLLSAGLFFGAFFTDAQKSEKIIQGAAALLSFVGGYEAGRLREKVKRGRAPGSED